MLLACCVAVLMHVSLVEIESEYVDVDGSPVCFVSFVFKVYDFIVLHVNECDVII